MSLSGPPLVRRHPLVYGDIIEIAECIARDSTESALRFFDDVETTIEGLAEMPGKGPRCGFSDAAVADVRFYTVNGFPNHLIFYRPTRYGIYILSVRHGARALPGDLGRRG